MNAQPARTKITAKGQVTLRRHLLDQAGVKPGDQLEWVASPGRLEARPVAKPTGWDAFFGSIKSNGEPSLTIEEMNDIIAKGWAGELVFDD